MIGSVSAAEKAAIIKHLRAQYSAMGPEAPEDDDTVSALRMLIDDVRAMLGRAERALEHGDADAAIDMLHSAGRDLAGACHEA